MNRCKHCRKDCSEGFNYCNEFCEIQGLKKQLKDIDNQKEYEKILNQLKKQGVTQNEIAEYMGTTKQHISNLKLGRTPVSQEHLSKLKEINKGK